MSQQLKLGELCAGYGGLGMAVEEVFNAETAWFSEYDAAPSKILAHHWPDVPNYGDMTAIDWAAIEPVDIISGGTPCQDLSAAGRRAGMTEGTRSNLWVQMREAIATQRPRYVVWENVRGAYSATATSDLEHCPGCMGDAADRGAVLRALGRVLGDLSDLGYDCQWRGLRAADVGACHGRFRVFVLAYDARSIRGCEAIQHDGRGATANDRAGIPDQPDRDSLRPGPLGEATTNPGSEAGEQRPGLCEGSAGIGWGRLANDSGAQSAADAESIGRGEGRAEPAGKLRGLATAGDRASIADATGNDAPTDAHRAVGRASQRQRPRPGEAEGWRPSGVIGGHSLQGPTNWGDYEPAIRRWEARLGRPAPRPTEPTGRNNGERLSPRFTEWMMGLPDGWVTDPAIGISRNEQLKACGNGVVPQQAMAALRDMLATFQHLDAAA